MANESESDLLAALRSTPEVPPTPSAELMKTLFAISNQLDDIKLKLDIANETSLELLEEAKRGSRSDFAGQARLIRNKPPTSFRRL